MPDQAQAPVLWASVANTFKSNLAVIFDIFNEPYPDNNAWDSYNAWSCWQNGNNCNLPYAVAGMQSLVNAIRNAGSTNIVMLGGIQYATSLTEWNNWKPSDPTGKSLLIFLNS